MPKVIRPDGYNIWRGILKRCLDPNSSGYAAYGGIGISVCERWRTSFANFIADMGPRPSRQHQVDRKNSSGNYEPDNCRWVTAKENQNNRRDNLRLTFQGRTQTAAMWADELGIRRNVMYDRLAKGHPIEWALSPRIEKQVRFTPEEDAVIRSLAGQRTAAQIGRELRRTESSIWARAHVLKISLKPNRLRKGGDCRAELRRV